MFFDITRPVLDTNEYYAVEDAELYFKKTNVDGTIITPNSVDETSVITYISKYYDPSQNSANVKEEDITWLYIGTSHLNE
jgi:ABC-type branched-subunit amino acid transport system ATPase component